MDIREGIRMRCAVSGTCHVTLAFAGDSTRTVFRIGDSECFSGDITVLDIGGGIIGFSGDVGIYCCMEHSVFNGIGRNIFFVSPRYAAGHGHFQSAFFDFQVIALPFSGFQDTSFLLYIIAFGVFV